MIVGFNHNIKYQDEAFHVQTEDSGLKAPHVITLLYHRGTIISSLKQSYAEHVSEPNLDDFVEKIAKEQHKQMMKNLASGELNDRLEAFGVFRVGSSSESAPKTVSKAQSKPEDSALSAQAKTTEPSEDLPEIKLSSDSDVDKLILSNLFEEDEPKEDKKTSSIDDLILSFINDD